MITVAFAAAACFVVTVGVVLAVCTLDATDPSSDLNQD